MDRTFVFFLNIATEPVHYIQHFPYYFQSLVHPMGRTLDNNPIAAMPPLV